MEKNLFLNHNGIVEIRMSLLTCRVTNGVQLLYLQRSIHFCSCHPVRLLAPNIIDINIYQILKNYVTIPSISLYDCNAIRIDTMVSLLDTKVAE